MKRCVVIGGADIGRYDRIRTYLQEDDFLCSLKKFYIIKTAARYKNLDIGNRSAQQRFFFSAAGQTFF